MTAPRPPQPLADLLAGAGLGHVVRGDAGTLVQRVAPLASAGSGDFAFAAPKSPLTTLRDARASVLVVDEAQATEVGETVSAVVACREPARLAARVSSMLNPDWNRPSLAPSAGVTHSTAVVAASAVIADDAAIGPFCVIGENVQVGAGAVLGAHVTVGHGVAIGAGCLIHDHVSLMHCTLDERVVVHPGARIGAAGFGFLPAPPEGHEPVPQVGHVRIGAGASIGANTTIDRATLAETVIGPGAIIDNLVQVAHNASLGRGAILAAQVGLAGSVSVGAFAALGGQVGVADHVSIGDGGRVTGQSGLMRDVAPGETVAGTPAVPVKEYWRQVATLAQLARKKPGSS